MPVSSKIAKAARSRAKSILSEAAAIAGGRPAGNESLFFAAEKAPDVTGSQRVTRSQMRRVAARKASTPPSAPAEPEAPRAVAEPDTGDIPGGIVEPAGAPSPSPPDLAATPSGEVVRDALIAEHLWRTAGGTRSVNGLQWERLRRESRAKNKPSDAQSYFVLSALRWMRDPERAAKENPREARIIEQLWQEYSK